MESDVFENQRSGAKARELRAYPTESEEEAKMRLESAGWKFSISYEWDDNQKMFKAGASAGIADGDSKSEGAE